MMNRDPKRLLVHCLCAATLFLLNARMTWAGFSLSVECVAKVVDVQNGSLRYVATGCSKNIAFLGDSDVVAFGNGEGVVIAAIESSEPKSILPTKSAGLVRSNRNGTLLAVAEANGGIDIWDTRTARPVRSLKPTGDAATVMAWSPDDALIAVTDSKTSLIHVSDPQSGEELFQLRGHTAPVTAMAFSADGRLLASGGRDQTIRVWDLRLRREIRLLQGHTGWVLSLAFHPTTQLLASSGGDGTLRIWNLADGRETALPTEREIITALTFNQQGQLASGTARGKLQVHTLQSGQWQTTALPSENREGPAYYELRSDVVSEIAYNRDGTLLSVSQDGTMLPPRLLLLAVGIDYKGTTQEIQFGEADARAVVQSFESVGGAMGGQTVLLTGTVRREDIQKSLETLAIQSGPQDVFVFYFAGQQETKGREQSLVTSDAVVNGGEVLVEGAVSMDLLSGWFSQIEAERQIVLFDTDGAKTGLTELFSKSLMTSSISRRLLAMGPSGPAYEDDQRGHGFFTSRLMSALAGDADREPKDGTITASELMSYFATPLQERLRPDDTYAALVVSDFPINGNEQPVRFARDATADRGVGEAPEASAPATVAGKNYALLIATDTYDNPKWPKLNNPTLDAAAIGAELQRRYGFEVERLENPTKNALDEKLTEYYKKPNAKDSQLFVFIAGHGYYDQLKSMGFVVTRDSGDPTVDKSGGTFYDFPKLRDTVDNMPFKHILLVLDSCYSGTFDRNVALNRGANDDEAPPDEIHRDRMQYMSRYYISSGGRDIVSDGVAGQHSPFARWLLEALRNPIGKGRVLTYAGIAATVTLAPKRPFTREFGQNEAGGEFVMVVAGSN